MPWNAAISAIGLGAHHAGVGVYGEEYAFQRDIEGSGIVSCAPR
eukprot:gene27859-22995_t